MVFFVALFVVRARECHDLPTNGFDLPVTQYSTPLPGAHREDALRVNLTREGSLYLGYERISMNDLIPALHEGVKNGSERVLYLSIGAHSRYEDTRSVLDQIRLAGIEKISFVTEQPHAPRLP
jgi:biopolymer transport protein TolR